MVRNKTLLWITPIALLPWAAAVDAQQNDRSIEEVIVRSSRLDTPGGTSNRLGLSPLETPASVHVLSGDAILERGDFSIQDALGRMVGVSDQGSSGNGGGSVSARGFSGVNSIMRLYDGVQMFVAAGTMTFPSDTWTVDRIEVLGGPSSSLYGTGAVGGIVNVIPRKPSRDTAHRYRLTAGSNGTYRAGVDMTGPIAERLSYRVSASNEMSDGWAERADSKSLAVSASLRFDISPTLSLTLSEDYGDQHPATNSALPLIEGRVDESLRRKNYNVLDADRRYKDSWTQLKVDWTPSEALSIRSTSYYLTADRRWFGAGSVSYQESSGLLERRGGSDLTHDLQQLGNSTNAVLTGELFGKAGTLAVGFDFNRLTFEHVYWVSQATTLLDVYDPVPGTFQYFPGGYNYINLFHADQYALFAEGNLELTPRLSLLAGIRKDRYEVDRNEHLTGVRSDASFDPASWRIGLLHKLRPGLTVYGNLSTATDPAGSVGNMSAAAQQMKMMTGEQVEVGVKQSFAGGRGQWSAAAYRIVKNDLQVPVPDEPGVTQQVGRQSSTGIEVSASLTLADTVRLDVNGTKLNARFDDFSENVAGVFVRRDGNTPRNIPEETANLWISWNFLPKWHIRGGVRYVGERFAGNDNSASLDSYTVVDGSVRWDVNENSKLDLRLFNAFDRFYTRGNSTTSWTAAPPRTTELSWTSSL